MTLSMTMLMLLLFLSGPSSCSSWSPLSRCTISLDVEDHGLYYDCQGRSLNEIPKDFLINTTSINLSQNHIRSVLSDSFSSVPKLRNLDLSHNDISSIEPRAFWKCQSLKALDIARNNVYLNGTVFMNLDNLQELTMDGCYDAKVLQPLAGLESIEIFAEQGCVVDGSEGLVNLENLRIEGEFFCRNNTFEKFNSSKLVTLIIDAVLVHIEINALAPLLHLKELSFINTVTGLSKIFESMYAFRNRELETLVIDNAKSNFASMDIKEVEGRTLTKERLKYFCQICLKNFSAPNNLILYIDILYIESSPIANCLKHFDLSRNMITTFPSEGLVSLMNFTKLEYLDFSDQAIQPITNSGVSNSQTIVKGFILTVPKGLKVFLLRGVAKNWSNVQFDITIKNGQRVEKVDFSFNGLKSLKHIYGFQNVVYFDVSGNEILVLSNDFFRSFKKIETLRMTDLSFRQTIVDAQGKMFLSFLPQLKYLDISGNRLVQLPPDLFKLNPLLEHLDLSRNIFTSIPVHLSILPNLLLLNVSSNSIGSLDKETTDDIDSHFWNTNKLFGLRLMGNFFECSCGNLQFLFWLSETELLAGESEDLSCITEYGNIIKTKDVLKHVLKFWRKCKGYETFSEGIILGFFLFCGILMALLIDTNKTKLAYYLINALKYKVTKVRRKDFKTDVFLSYADADYRWACHELGANLEERNLNLFIWDRDSVPGDCTAEVITETVNQCWKTILYFTENYERDAWSYLTTMAAINCVDNLNPERLILLLPENENPRVPECLLQVVPESCIFYIPQNIERPHAFWDQLEGFIKKET